MCALESSSKTCNLLHLLKMASTGDMGSSNVSTLMQFLRMSVAISAPS